jgi:hypothetical protein
MKTYLIGYAAIVATASAACTASPPPAAKAARTEQLQCVPGQTAQQEDELVRSTHVLNVEPIYSHVRTSNNDAEERVNGAKLLVRPPQGMTVETMTRLLQCHSARILLGQTNADAVTSDPYWLPDTWMNIEVHPEDGNYAVTLSASSIGDNLKVLSRANRYGAQQMATAPELP